MKTTKPVASTSNKNEMKIITLLRQGIEDGRNLALDPDGRRRDGLRDAGHPKVNISVLNKPLPYGVWEPPPKRGGDQRLVVSVGGMVELHELRHRRASGSHSQPSSLGGTADRGELGGHAEKLEVRDQLRGHSAVRGS